MIQPKYICFICGSKRSAPQDPTGRQSLYCFKCKGNTDHTEDTDQTKIIPLQDTISDLREIKSELSEMLTSFSRYMYQMHHKLGACYPRCRILDQSSVYLLIQHHLANR